MAINKDEISRNRTAMKEQALELRQRGFNCAQAVACVLAPMVDIDVDTAFRLAEGFGSGMGGMTETCGAITGAVMAFGQMKSTGPSEPTSKGRTYALSRELCRRFAEKNGSNVCRVLKGVGTDTGALRSCPGCIEDVIDLFCDIVFELEPEA